MRRKAFLRQDRNAIMETRILAHVRRLLNDDGWQNRMYPPELFPGLSEDRETPDELPGASGAFGRDAHNPIPCNGPIGELTYLSRLRLSGTGEKVFFHRAGSVGSAVSENPLDIFEVISLSGRFYDVLYMDMYHPGKSGKQPAGYIAEDSVEELRGLTNASRDFPENLYADILDESLCVLGIPLVDEDVRQIDIERARESIRQRRTLSFPWQVRLYGKGYQSLEDFSIRRRK